jgi:integrase
MLSYQSKLIFDFSIETGLRISDILSIKAGQIAKTMNITESKTKKQKLVEISDGLFLRLKYLKMLSPRTPGSKPNAKLVNPRYFAVEIFLCHQAKRKIQPGGVDKETTRPMKR